MCNTSKQAADITIQYKTLVDSELQEKLVEKILVMHHSNNSSLVELTRIYNIWWIKLWQIANYPPNAPKFCPAKILCCIQYVKRFVQKP